ncbi:NAD-dependent epimerase/dehydratase family protein [Novosphingobium ginsenosidimutans]|uniref:NAD-dependent epimerase/dehydratase family protein n=1 Tax=Novosphingobium ginsenosidimutans TaxID=1176536 RepID=UPI00192DAA6C|nr:NAD-dependent epimerase/dehydratase family protein [Novosphingobium ginsenosidimutans]
MTGGAGFHGSHFCDRLVARGNGELCVDNFYTRSKANVAHLLGKTSPALMRHDAGWSLYFEVEQIFDTSGVRMHRQDSRGASNFVGRAGQGEDQPIYGNGMQTRRFCYVNDLVEAMLKLMDSPAVFTGPNDAEIVAEGPPGKRAKGNNRLLSHVCQGQAWSSRHPHTVPALKPRG